MKFRIASDQLYSHLQQISRVIVQKNTVGILDCVLFDLKDGVLTLTASDGDTRLMTSLKVEEQDGSNMQFAVKSRLLLDPLKEISGQLLLFDIQEDKLEVRVDYHNGTFSFRAESARSYPEVKQSVSEPVVIEMPQKLFLKGLGYTLFATSTDEARPITTGIYFDFKEDHLIFVGTDGFILSMYKDENFKCGKELGFTFQKKPALILRNILDKDSEDSTMRISVYSNYAQVETDKVVMQCLLIEGKYPNYAAVIPKHNVYQVQVDRLQMLYGIRRVSMFANPAIGLVSLDVDSQKMIAKSNDTDFSTAAQEEIPISYDGEPQMISFRAMHLLNVLSNFNSETISLRLGDKTSPGLFSPVEIGEGESVTALVMPLMR